jgi:protocatechuate 3,4-dioxygenase beta subunit
MHHDDHRHGLEFDLEALAQQRLRRRSLLTVLGTGTLVALAGTMPGLAQAAELCLVDAETTNGPYPADGTNTAPGGTSNILAESGVIRSDIRASFGTSTGTAEGITLTVTLKLADFGKDCAALPGATIYIWHCTQDGLYSLYTLPEENFLRGVQVAGDDGMVTFTTVFPGCYRGRWPHIHFEVYRDQASATDHKNALLTSQLALPQDVCELVYATAGYTESPRNLAELTLTTDNVFSRANADQLTMMTPNVTGSVAEGFVATATIAVEV